MFWLDEITEEIMKAYPADKALIARDEKTASGRVHVGSLRGVVIHELIVQALREKGRQAKFYYEINDVDPMDGLPTYLDQEKFKPYMGKPLKDVPAPEGSSAKNFAVHFGEEFVEVINKLGYYPEIVWASELYESGRYNESIEKILGHPDEIRAIYKEVSGSTKPADWFPLQVTCEKCGRVGTTKVTGVEDNQVTYECMPQMVEWAEGCGHKGKVSPYDGRGKLPWKVEWAVKWAGMPVDIEGSGKDHNAAGGSHDISAEICEKILEAPVPFNIPYEFFLIGGAKMSASSGLGASAKEVAETLPVEVLRFLLTRAKPNQPIEFNPEGETIPRLYDRYDQAADEYFGPANGAGGGKEFPDLARAFYFSQYKTREEAEKGEVVEPKDHFRPRLSRIAFMLQIPHLDLEKEGAALKDSDLTPEDLTELKTREKFAKMWLSKYALPMHKFEIQMETPAVELTAEQGEFLRAIADLLEEKDWKGEELHGAIHELKKNSPLEAKQAFQAIYLALLGKDSGPQAGWFLEALEKDFVVKRFREVQAISGDAGGDSRSGSRMTGGSGTTEAESGEPKRIIDDPKIVVGQIEKVEQHPDADKLKVAQVKVAPDQVNQIVCGDLDIYEGMVAPVSLPGAHVKWHGEEELSKVKKTNLRGIKSAGMLLSPEEIGLDTKIYPADKIVDLKGLDAEVGQPLKGLANDLKFA